MNLVWVYTSNFTSVSTGILSDLNWNHSLNKSMPTLPDAMEIPLWSTHLTKPWQWGIAWRSSRSSADISIGIQGWNNYCRIWVGPLGLLLWGNLLSTSRACCHLPAGLWLHSGLGGPGESSLYVWMGEKVSSSIKWHSTSRKLNSILLLSSSILETSSGTPFSQKAKAKLCITACSLLLDFICVEKTVMKC